MKPFGKPMFNNSYRVDDVVEPFSLTGSRFVIFEEKIHLTSHSIKILYFLSLMDIIGGVY